MAITLRNPHSILAALQKRPQDFKNVRLPKGMQHAGQSGTDPIWREIEELARKNKVQVLSTSSAGERDRHSSPNDGRTGSAGEATVADQEGVTLDELFENASERNEGKGLWIALDCIQDPHNLGAIFRTAAFFGVEGFLITLHRSAPLSAAVYDVACGGMESVPFVMVPNLKQGLEAAKEAGLWILGTSEHAEQSLAQIERDRPWLLVLGNEEKGLRRLTQENCDVLCQIPPLGAVTSLNVSVAAGISIAHLSMK